jgi:hypothetical protein
MRTYPNFLAHRTVLYRSISIKKTVLISRYATVRTLITFSVKKRNFWYATVHAKLRLNDAVFFRKIDGLLRYGKVNGKAENSDNFALPNVTLREG